MTDGMCSASHGYFRSIKISVCNRLNILPTGSIAIEDCKPWNSQSTSEDGKGCGIAIILSINERNSMFIKVIIKLTC